VDDLSENNPPSHPQLMEDLSSFFIKAGFDLRQLYRALANSQVYHLTSRTEDAERPPPELFARMPLRPLTPDQFYDSLNRSLRQRLESAAADGTEQPFGADPLRQAFLARLRAPTVSGTEYRSGIVQALALINGAETVRASDPESGGLLAALDTPFFSDAERLDTLFLATLSRLPGEAERSSLLEYLAESPDDESPHSSLGDILWALLNSAEFAMNH
jgi:hypothetical protein